VERTEILQEIEALFIMHEKLAQSSECREFNRRAASRLEKLEEEGLFRMADSVMDHLVACNLKDLSQCDQLAVGQRYPKGVKEQWEDCAIEKKI
jgi:hypothetical protein